MKFVSLFLILFLSSSSQADLLFSPRYDYIGGKYELANRLQFQSKLNANYEAFSFYAEGFADFDSAASAKKYGRSTDKAFLQEAYVEYKWESFFFRLGKQAMRWSESWSLPSLDIWTGRKFNRLFFDDFSNQLNHSNGISASYASEKWSGDLVLANEVGETTWPTALGIQPSSDKKNHFGARAKYIWKGLAVTGVAARINNLNSLGIGLNYAFDSAVPKFEYGTLQEKEVFTTLGCDLFLGNWILLPQVTSYKDMATYYSSLQWNPGKHDLQTQVYYNSKTEDSFLSVSYGYNWTDSVSTSGFLQNYAANQPGLYAAYKEITGNEIVLGIKFVLTENFVF